MLWQGGGMVGGSKAKEGKDAVENDAAVMEEVEGR
jgi:hypothetical protein